MDKPPTVPPSHIDLPPIPSFPDPRPHSPDPFSSPCLQFHTAPSSPFVDTPPHPSPTVYFTPPSSPLTDAPPITTTTSSPPPALKISIPSPPIDRSAPPRSPTDDPFPTSDLSIDLALDEEGLNTLERIYLFSTSKATFHRVFITHALPSFLEQVTPQEAIEYVLPLLSGLAMDDEEQVKEALAADLVPVIWWFFTHCQIIPGDLRADETVYPSSSLSPTISVQAFTPVLGTLLLSSNPLVGGAARCAIVDLLSRMKKADDGATLAPRPASDDDDDEWVTGLFARDERAMFRSEILHQVVIGMGRLDVDIDEQFDGMETDIGYGNWQEANSEGRVEVVTPGEQGNGEDGVSSPQEMQRERAEAVKMKDGQEMNPYFPMLPSSFSVHSPASSATSTPSPTATADTSGSFSSPSSSPATPFDNSTSFPGTKEPARKISPLALDSDNNISAPVSASDDECTRPPLAVGSVGLSAGVAVPEQATYSHPVGSSVRGSNWVPTAPRPSHATLPEPRDAQAHEERRSSPASPPRPTSPVDLGEAVRRFYNVGDIGSRESYNTSDDGYPEAYGSDEAEQDEQATVGRLSSMSLMAAVTASGSLSEDTKEAFVREVERVGRDPVYWVRREASFALGALAKVVPAEIVLCSLLPLFDALCRDSVWHVRHSALFALPAILSRLQPSQRRALALETIESLVIDSAATVRTGVLEALGEVLHTFHVDEGGPPARLLHLFLGRQEDRRVRDGQQMVDTQRSPKQMFARAPMETPLESFYHDPERPLVCAFNYPAVALTLGRERWGELREAYLDIAANRAFRVRRTLAASLGELAKIIGAENAGRDLVGVWWDAIRCEDEEVRGKAVECVAEFVPALGEDARTGIMEGLVRVWDEGVLRGWREREGVAKALVSLAKSGGWGPAMGLVRRALEDNVAAVRETAVAAVPGIWASQAGTLQADLQRLAVASSYRRRMTFVACAQALAMAGLAGATAVRLDDAFWAPLFVLAADPIDGVRIGVARLAGIVSASSHPISGVLLSLIQRLRQDHSHEVQSYVPDSLHPLHPDVRPNGHTRRRAMNLSTFSRPPPARTPSQQLLDAPWPPFNIPSDDIDRTFNGSTRGDINLGATTAQAAAPFAGGENKPERGFR